GRGCGGRRMVCDLRRLLRTVAAGSPDGIPKGCRHGPLGRTRVSGDHRDEGVAIDPGQFYAFGVDRLRALVGAWPFFLVLEKARNPRQGTGPGRYDSKT